MSKPIPIQVPKDDTKSLFFVVQQLKAAVEQLQKQVKELQDRLNG